MPKIGEMHFQWINMYFTFERIEKTTFIRPNSLKMRTAVILLCLVFCFSSCQDQEKKDEKENTYQTEESKDDIGTSAQDQPIDQNTNNSKEDSSKPESTEEKTNTSLSGVYIKNDHMEDSDCSCYCIDVKVNGTSELCLTEDKLYIKGRFEKSGDNINIYYSGKSSGNADRELPWDKFETGTPIAVLSTNENGNLKLDWKGFSIDGEIAIDYALFGKKTLEGTYKKK